MTDIPHIANAAIANALPASVSDEPAASVIPDIHQKYAEERAKRLETPRDYVELGRSDAFHYMQEDLWVDHSALNSQTPPVKDGDAVKFLVLGAGYAGLLFAVRLVQAGFRAEDIRIVDAAGGFGGTWYWNRYPGLMCDTESYIYMPLLEETGHMPKHKYAYGPELRQHADTIAKKWELEDKALFRTEVKRLEWDDAAKQWVVSLTENRGPGETKKDLGIRAQFVFLASGVLNYPQIPKLPGIEKFKGHHFHTSRWDYAYTGGSPEEPTLVNLKDKKVGIIGTGATAIQAVPQLAKWAKELYVFQRTPSAVDARGQRATNPEEWNGKIACKKGWQRERMENFNSWVSNAPEGENLVGDGFANMPSYSALIGGPKYGIIVPEKVAEHVANMHALDAPRSNRVRARVDEIVKDKETAEKLKAWYPGWCKRPTFHDDYLPAFNQPNVKVVDTGGKGVERLTETGVVANGQEYPVDLLVLGTGYRGPGTGSGSPAHRANITVIGRDGKNIDDKWLSGVATLHGVMTHDFPNLFFPGLTQTGASANYTFVVDVHSRHVAHILREVVQRAEAEGFERYGVEPSVEAEEEWTMQIVYRAAALAAVVGCTPGYINSEGEVDKPKDHTQMMKAARGGIWGEGVAAYTKVIEAWRDQGGLVGVEIVM
ncbi:pyridine nucleotide-disulfide oxidoreductase-like protein [Mycena epipterygia]|nr:pyridine nucleotide-disulfide oxidoreductase-like protein [Mycena epipterygia]